MNQLGRPPSFRATNFPSIHAGADVPAFDSPLLLASKNPPLINLSKAAIKSTTKIDIQTDVRVPKNEIWMLTLDEWLKLVNLKVW